MAHTAKHKISKFKIAPRARFLTIFNTHEKIRTTPRSPIGEIRCFSDTWVAVSWRIFATVVHFELEQNVDFLVGISIFGVMTPPLGPSQRLRSNSVGDLAARIESIDRENL